MLKDSCWFARIVFTLRSTSRQVMMILPGLMKCTEILGHQVLNLDFESWFQSGA